MKFSKSKSRAEARKRRPISRVDADIIAAKNIILDKELGYDLPTSFYDEMSDRICKKPSRKSSL